MTREQEVAWSRQQWALLADRGTWGVPRSGLVFQKREAEQELVVIARMPHEASLSITADELREQQDGDIAAIALRFAEFGVTVREEA